MVSGTDELARGGPQADVHRRPAEVAAPALEADYAPPTGSQGVVVADALRTLAAWAVRAARRGEETAPTPSPAANNPLDFLPTSSDECNAIPGHEER
jgi:hypothetical protein